MAESCLDNGAAAVYSIDIAEPGQEFQATEKKYPGKLRFITADTTKEATITAAVDKIVEECGAIHGMVVNAGRTNHKAALDFTEEEIHALFNINVGYLPPYLRLVAGLTSSSRYLAHSTVPEPLLAHSSS